MGAVSILRGGLALELSPCARALKSAIRLPRRQDLVASRERTRCPVRGRAPSSGGTTQPGAGTTIPSAPCAAPCAKTAVRSPWPRPLAERLILQYRDHPALELPTPLRQSRRLGEGGARAGAAPFLFHDQTLHAGPWPGKETEGSFSSTPWRDSRQQRRQTREIRSYEAKHVGALWHLDFHHGSLKVLTPGGKWLRPIALGILDDHSRLCCHVQWYFSETAEDLVHGLSQAIQKRGLPRALLTDNGSAMLAEEVTEGLLRLGVVHERTLPYSPYQNGKQEAFWGTLEGRLMKMLDGVAELTLDLLNHATQAWMEIEYNRAVHRETKSSPVERFAQAPDVLRSSPSSESLRDTFRLETNRSQRQSDGTISVEGVRFEIPGRYRHFREMPSDAIDKQRIGTFHDVIAIKSAHLRPRSYPSPSRLEGNGLPSSPLKILVIDFLRRDPYCSRSRPQPRPPFTSRVWIWKLPRYALPNG